MGQRRIVRFAHLHIHTHYSLLDGVIKIPALFERAKELGLEAIAITDHGNMHGCIEFYTEGKKTGIKPIIGCEVYLADNSRFDRTREHSHLTLLCKNNMGYQNLIKLVTLANTEGFYYKPRIDKELLSKYSEGLMGLSGCLHGAIATEIIKRSGQASYIAKELNNIFGKDNFYLELQANGLIEQEKVNEESINLGYALDIPLVATNDCHYLTAEDAYAHEILLCIQTKKTLKDEKRFKFNTNELYLKSPAEMQEYFKGYEIAIKNTTEIAARCNIELELDNYKFPDYKPPMNIELKTYLAAAAYRGLEFKLQGITPEYIKRLEYELEVITEKDFSGYLLIVADFISWAKSKNIAVGPGRGSAAGSLVCYGLGITDINPIPYGLLFERFLNPERKSLPDIDVDFCDTRRDEVYGYLQERYGDDKVAQIATFGHMNARAVLRDVGRVLDIDYDFVNNISKQVPFYPKVTIANAINEVGEIAKASKEYPEWFDVAKKLEGVNRHLATHAAGVVISDKPIIEYMPLVRAPGGGQFVTQYDMKAVERVGLIKFDLLGLKTLTVIEETLKQIHLNLSNIPLDDKETFELLCNANTGGVFQLESYGMRALLKRLQPNLFEDLIAICALYRPGPLNAGMTEEFIRRKNGAKYTYEIPLMERILKNTYGVIVYQEQIMNIACTLAGYTPGEADNFRRAIGKKIPEAMEAERTKFIEGASEKIEEQLAADLFEQIAKFAKYSFNMSHSAAYAMIAYQTAYLKTHYPLQFMAAVLTAEIGNRDGVKQYYYECKNNGIVILPPDINKSQYGFVIEGEAIRFALAAMKQVGEKAATELLTVRKQSEFMDLGDLLNRTNLRIINKRVMEVLISSGALQCIGIDKKLSTDIDTMLKEERKRKKKNG